jgi:hypothetical protein
MANVKPRASVGPSERKDDDGWLKSLYDITLITEEDVKQMYAEFAYKGFDREKILKQLQEAIPDPKIALRAIVVIALRGPQKASTVKIDGVKSLSDLRIPAGGGKGKDIITCSKIQAATADLAAFMLKKMRVPKRLNVECPGWLQFPSAGSIKLPPDLRAQHKEFSIKFSSQIGGNFNESIYFQMEQNAYLDSKLNLFN